MKPASADLLIELGTEELPPNALRQLSTAFSSAVVTALHAARLSTGDAHSYATPRRLAVVVEDVDLTQPDQQITQKGPPIRIAFDADGAVTKAGTAFARKCGVEVDQLERVLSGKDEVLLHTATQVGLPAAELLPGIVSAALDALPVPRRMRWGAHSNEFVRPAHWLVVLHGDSVVPCKILNVEAGRNTHGHRFQSPGDIEIHAPATFCEKLKAEGFVLADLDERRAVIVAAVTAAARAAGGKPVGGDTLFDEVTALTEWPVAVTGAFDQAFLKLPKEVIIETLTSHQRYFPVLGDDDKLLPVFITVANLESLQPERVRDGNERVVRPRLADAAFFWETDRQMPLAQRAGALNKVVYQKGLGTLHDKSVRVAAIASALAEQCGIDPTPVRQAAELAKCDLLTGMVGEFPKLQGVMGQYYATGDGEPQEVCTAIGEHYLPRFAGDDLPGSITGQLLAVADRLDTLTGIFLLGKKPTGNRDPFGLRRATLGSIRIVVEKQLDLDFSAAVAAAVEQQPVRNDSVAANVVALNDYIVERLRSYFVDDSRAFSLDMFEAVRSRQPDSLVDFQARLEAVADFRALPAAASLAAANKRTANILRKSALSADAMDDLSVDEGLLEDEAEKSLFAALQLAKQDLEPLIASRAYTEGLRRLALLREPIDAFFEDVMVMTDDETLRRNRLALLSGLLALFLEIADISRLTPPQD